MLHTRYTNIISWLFSFWEKKMLIGSSELAVEFTIGSSADMLYLIESERLCVLYCRKGMRSLITQYIITHWSRSEFFRSWLLIVCANEESGRADDHSLVFLFAEPRLLHAILPIASHTPNRIEKIRLCVSKFCWHITARILADLVMYLDMTQRLIMC